MTKDDVKKIVLEIIEEIAPDEDLTDVKADVRLRDQLDLDSMDFLDIVMELRKQHGIEVPEEQYTTCLLLHLWSFSISARRRFSALLANLRQPVI